MMYYTKSNLARSQKRDKKEPMPWTEHLPNPAETKIIIKRKRKYEDDRANEKPEGNESI